MNKLNSSNARTITVPMIRHRLSPVAIAFIAALGFCTVPVVTYADESKVVEVQVNCDSERTCSFDVTLLHADAGWDHYANHWRVLATDGAEPGKELGRRVLHHPHDNEQPFTRSLSGVVIPADVSMVTIESHDSVHEYGGETVNVTIP